MNMFCYTFKHIVAIAITIVSTVIVYNLPNTNMLIVNIFYKSGLLILLFSIAIVYFNVSAEMNQIYRIIKEKLFSYF